jgi:hypothetical protein
LSAFEQSLQRFQLCKSAREDFGDCEMTSNLANAPTLPQPVQEEVKAASAKMPRKKVGVSGGLSADRGALHTAMVVGIWLACCTIS